MYAMSVLETMCKCMGSCGKQFDFAYACPA